MRREGESPSTYSTSLHNYDTTPRQESTRNDCKKRPIELQEAEAEGEDYYLKVKSPSKALKEQSMNRSFRRCFEDGMKTIAASLGKKGGTKKYEAVVKRIAKLEGRYPSIARYYSIAVEKDEKNKVTSVTWSVQMPDEEVFGTYSLRTNVRTLDEKTAWDYYNLIREIECSNYEKFIVMRSYIKCISDYQNVTYLLLISALHNNMVAMTSFHLNVRTNGYQKDFL